MYLWGKPFIFPLVSLTTEQQSSIKNWNRAGTSCPDRMWAPFQQTTLVQGPLNLLDGVLRRMVIPNITKRIPLSYKFAWL